MRLQEARDAGTEDGIRFAETFSDDQLRGALHEQSDNIAAAAIEGLRHRGLRSTTSPQGIAYRSQFESAARQRFVGRRAALPDVRQADIRFAADRHIESVLKASQDTITKWRARYDANAADAFEWSDSAMQAAARQDVYVALAGLLAQHDVAEVRAEAAREALRGALYPSHSTSQTGNLMHQYRTQAWAEFAERTVVA